ncbi:hypothetical protein BJX65DRAFT_14735 [Aspergillus insuetus]
MQSPPARSRNSGVHLPLRTFPKWRLRVKLKLLRLFCTPEFVATRPVCMFVEEIVVAHCFVLTELSIQDPLDDNGLEDTDTPEERVPYAECAKKLSIKGPGGRIISPLQCNYSDEDDPCSECIRLGINCNHLMWTARETALEIQKMKPGQAALKATQALSARVKGVWEIHHQTDALLWELRNINRNVFRVVNELRESNSKRPLHLGFLEDWSEAWDETKNKKDE